MSIAPCPPSTPVVRGVVIFSPTAFKAAFPQFSTIADAILTMNFSFAELQLANTCCGTVKNAVLRESLLNLLVAHITQILNGINGQPPAGIVGRVDKATEGSVSVSADMGTVVYGQAYYNQTQWGLMYWQATARFRTMRYIVAPPTCADLAAVGPAPFGTFDDCGC